MPKGYLVTNDDDSISITGEKLYLGDETTEGSKRFAIDDDTGFTTIQKKIDGLWQPASFKTGPNSLWVGQRVGIAGVGQHIATEDSDGGVHFHTHNDFNGTLSTSEAKIIDAFLYFPKGVIQGDDSGSFTGTVLDWEDTAPISNIGSVAYFRTLTTEVTEPVRLRVWEGAADTGILLFDQFYPASDFPVSSEISLPASGYLEFTKGLTYFYRLESEAPFSLKMNAAETVPWFAADFTQTREDDLLQTEEWADGNTFTVGQWTIQDRKIYECNTAGVQTGTFADNIALWDILGSEAATKLWDRNEGVLTPENAGDDIMTAGRASFGDGEAPLRGVNIGSTDGVNSALLIATKLNTVGDTPAGVWFKHDSSIGDSKYKGAILFTREGSFGKGELHFCMNADSDGANTDLTESLMDLKYDGRFKVSGLTIEKTVPSLVYNDSTRDRLKIDATASNLICPDGRAGFKASLTDAEIRLGNGVVFNAAENGSTFMGLDGSNARLYLENVNDLRFYDGTTDRITADSIATRIKSPDNLNFMQTSNGGFLCNVNSSDRFAIASSETAFWSPNGLRKLRFNDTELAYYDGARDRIIADSSNVQLVSPDGTKQLSLLNQGIIMSKWISPNATHYIDVTNGTTEITNTDIDFTTTNRFQVSDTARVRLYSSSAESGLVSPDGTDSIKVSNSQVLITGNITYDTDVHHIMNCSEFIVNDGTNDIFEIESTYSKLTNTADTDQYITLSADDIKIHAGARDRIVIAEDGNTDIVSSNGGTILTVSDNDVYMDSTTGGFILPNMTTAQRTALIPNNGMMIYNTTDNQFNFYENGAWVTK